MCRQAHGDPIFLPVTMLPCLLPCLPRTVLDHETITLFQDETKRTLSSYDRSSEQDI
jgi:hypothetical protein